MSTRRNKTRFRQLISELNRGNIPAVLDAISPECEIQDERGVLLDKETYGLALSQSATTFPDHTFAINDLLADGDKVIVRYMESGTMMGEFMEFEATGRKFEAPAIEIWRFEGGMVTGLWMARDSLTVLSEVGLVQVEEEAAA